MKKELRVLTIEQLIKKLQQFDKKLPVYFVDPSDSYQSHLQPAITVEEGKAHDANNNVEKCIILSW